MKRHRRPQHTARRPRERCSASEAATAAVGTTVAAAAAHPTDVVVHSLRCLSRSPSVSVFVAECIGEAM